MNVRFLIPLAFALAASAATAQIVPQAQRHLMQAVTAANVYSITGTGAAVTVDMYP